MNHGRPLDLAEQLIVQGLLMSPHGLDVLRPLQLTRPADVGDETGKGRTRGDERQVDRQVLISPLLLLVGFLDFADLLRFALAGPLLDLVLDALPLFALR
jgi:hypothetical protein